MAKRKIVTVGKDRLNPANATELIRVTGEFSSLITLEMGGKEVNAKSLMGVITLGGQGGGDVLVTASGKDESKALETVVDFLS